MRSGEAKGFVNISATTANFTINGGCFGCDFHATWGGGSVTLNKLAADGATWVAAAASWTADGTVLVLLPRGIYQLAVVTATGVYVAITRIQGE